MESNLIEKWFNLYERDITSFLIYYTGSMDVEDLVQETFLRAMRKNSSYDGNAHPKTWLISIARNLVIDHFRRRRVWDRIRHMFLQDQSVSIDMERHIMMSQDNRNLYEAINKLPSNYKVVLILRGILEMSSKEVGEVIRSNENNVNVLYYRSLRKLKSLMEEEGYEYGGL
ncbi:RNA polymerase sigma factor [Bacillus sp. FJAT-22090]|uniref:RNA polymerase sigma factor n=1 Tax=Bacillus sp. FJAT-22090 TaxID=1581038 RepID=UPI0011AA9A73|nr:RNA polymerase sigma factor [Bacillus sp. FJAT-22090]